jgi:hypothetical protein
VWSAAAKHGWTLSVARGGEDVARSAGAFEKIAHKLRRIVPSLSPDFLMFPGCGFEVSKESVLFLIGALVPNLHDMTLLVFRCLP